MRILHLEDNPFDAELFGSFIREEWPQCEIDAVVTAEAFGARVAAQRYDLILSDFSIPGFDGMAALEVAQEHAPQTPFIFLSGTIGEERAVAAMRRGAADYVLKDRPKRLSPAIRRALAHAQEVRQKREAEAELQHVQRLEHLGMLAAGIAHDFNNVLAPVIMGIPLLRDHVTDPGKRAILASMEKSVERGAGLVRQILGSAHGSKQAQLVRPRHAVRELLAVIRQIVPGTISIEDRVPGELWLLEANPTELHQLFLNLCVNARDAMPKGGILRIAVENRVLDDAQAAEIPHARPGPYVVFEVSDTGIGIEPELLARIWEPFFTTKEAGLGTGLGLPTVRRIVAAHRGAITFRTAPRQGTSFTVFLPAAHARESD